jgi:hypothetical protein
MTTLASGWRGRPMVVAMAFALAAVVLIPSLAHAQMLYGTIVGRVTDPQQAALPGVTITATNTGTLLKLETVTDATGDYTFRNVPPGIYDLTVSLTGFKELRQTGLSVSAGNPKRINITLELGGVQETITVVAETTLIKTEKADLSTELTSKAVMNLPLNQYRNYQTLLNLVPGATPTMFQNAEIDTPGRSLRTFVNGIQPNANTTRVDGAVSVNLWLPHHAGYIQPAETVDTVNIATNNFDADTGMAAGAAQTVVTKSGTNEFRGSAFEFYNGDSLNNNTYYNNYYYLAKPPRSTNTSGGTLGGPIKKNKLFFFGSYEKFRDRRTNNINYSVPTDKMRNGDFTEVAKAYSSFKLYNPYSGTGVGGVGREQFPNFTIPGNLLDPIARQILTYYPPVNSPADLNSNGLFDDYVTPRETQVDRANYDLKVTWQRSSSHSIWGKFSMLRADVVDNYNLGWDNGSTGNTKQYVVAFGHTWTLSPTLVLDGNFGYYRQDQITTGPDFGQDIGIDLGIPGVNDPNDIRASGLPTFNTGTQPGSGYTIGGTPSWMPLYRHELNYTFSSALTKVFTKHEVRAGVDIIKFDLDHRQAEFGDYGLKGGFTFSGNTTAAPGYTPLSWNQFAGFLMGLASYYSKDTQTENQTTQEWQTALYVRDRWHVNDKLTVNLGLRLEGYPLMKRATHGIERLDYNTYMVSIGGLGGVPMDVGIKQKTWYFVPRLGASYRIDDKDVVRAGYGLTYNPLAWSRPMRGSFPYDINYNATAENYRWVTTLASGIPPAVIPDYNAGPVKLPAGAFMRSPNPGQNCGTFPTTGDPLPCEGLDRAKIQQWNVAFERKLPLNVAVEVAYVGTRTDGGYADLNLNYGEPGQGNPSRKFYAVAGTTGISDWAARTKTRYHGLQVAINRPFRQGLMLKGAYTYSVARNMTDEDGWVSLTWNHPMVYDKNYSYASFDRRHVFQMGFVYELPFLRQSTTTAADILGGWQVNGIFAYYTGTPFSISGTNNALNCQGCGSIYINVTGDPQPLGTVSLSKAWYDTSLFSQPTGLDAAGFGTSARNQFRRPPVWNFDLSLFKGFQIGRVRPELRIDMRNVFNHTNWGSPVTTYTANNFMLFTPSSTTQTSTVSGDIPGPRMIQIGVRVAF